MAILGPVFCPPPPPNPGSIDSCEIPAIFDTRLVTWLLRLEAIVDCALMLADCVFCALASVVLPNAMRLMISTGGRDGSELYVVCNWLTAPCSLRLMLYSLIVVLAERFTTGSVSTGFTNSTLPPCNTYRL